MSIIVVCHKCGTLATVPDSAAGMHGKCERCGGVTYVPGGVVKRCCVCQIDVSHTERTKDAAGNYYCAQCARAKRNAVEAEAAVKASATPEPGAASESAVCVLCKADVPKRILCNFDDDLVCIACAKQAGLGTTSYRKKKTRWGGRRVIYRCPQCQGDLESALDEAGKEDYCPQCGAAFDVPGHYEKLKATRPTTVPKPQGAVAGTAPDPADSQPSVSPETSPGPPLKTVMGKGKLLAISASAVAAVLVLASMINYVMMKPKTALPQARPAMTQANVAKPTATGTVAAAKVTAAQAGTAATKPVAAKGTVAKARPTPIPPKADPAAKLPPAKVAAPSVATDLLNQLKAVAAKVAVTAAADPNPVAASLPGFRSLSADVALSELESGCTYEGANTYVTISGTQAAATFPRWHAEATAMYPRQFVQPEWRIMVRGGKPITKMLTAMPLAGGGLAGFDYQKKPGTNEPMVKFYRHRGGVAGLVFIDSTELYNSLRTNSMQRARMVFRAYAAKNVGAVAKCMSAMGLPYCGIVVNYGIKRFGSKDAAIHARALVLIASCGLVNQFTKGRATIQLLMRKSDCFEESGSGGLFKIRVHY